MEITDVLIVGGGLLGCFAARALSAWNLRTVVFEAGEDVCTGVSRANTGIVYTGCDTRPGTLKTRLCVRANADFDRLCRELDVNFLRPGSLMVSFGPRADGVLQRKYRDGLENGVPGLMLLDRTETLRREPALGEGVTGSLFVPGTGVVNPWELGIAAFENARRNGVEFHFNRRVIDLTRRDGGYVAETEKGPCRTRVVLNCAGLSAHALRELVEKPLVRIFPSAGDYLVLDADCGGLLRHVIFHEPEEKGKGLTLTPTTEGNLLLGPTERPGTEDFSTDRAGLDELYRLCAEVCPSLPLDKVIRSFGALRPNPYYVAPAAEGWRREDKSISSFTILEEAGLFSLMGIKTPGLTCAKELGALMAERIRAYLNCSQRNESFDPYRRAIVRTRELGAEELNELIRRDPEYGRLVCRCRHISRGEIRDAIARGASTVDGIKRRVGTSTGRCQGGYCTQAVMELLSESLNIPPEAVRKDGPGSEILKEREDG